ncbi:MAG: alkaline phosphatase family protein [Acidobacteria bacterium]|nr:alkaline phosphatase family protein [Acidobacteriota bacterium]
MRIAAKVGSLLKSRAGKLLIAGAVTLAAAGALAVWIIPATRAAGTSPKVVVIGFDGADPGLVRQYMAEGRMPNLQRLAKEGAFNNLTVTNPPQTPVSWGAFITGLNPGRNHVFDFLTRDPKTYKPHFALMEEGSKTLLLGRWNRWVFPPFLLAIWLGAVAAIFKLRRKPIMAWSYVALTLVGFAIASLLFVFIVIYLPIRTPWPINHLEGKPFWQVAAEAGKRCIVIRMPDTFPAAPYPEGRLVAGLGVPDIRGRVGTPYIFTTDPALTGGDNEFSVDIVAVSEYDPQPITATIQGPFNKPFYEYAVDDTSVGATDPQVAQRAKEKCQERLKNEGVKPTIDLPLKLSWGDNSCTYEVQGQRGTLAPGQWSPWVTLDFAFNPLIHIKGMARFYLIKSSPQLQLYMSPIHFSPDDENVPICYPSDYSKKLMKRFGPFKTMGWAVDTWTISSNLAGEDQFLSDMNQTVDAFEKIMNGTIADKDWDLYVFYYEFTDRIAHVLWRYMDPKHPMYDAAKAPQYQEEMRKAYERMDKIVGEAMEKMPKDATLIVLSDHGFASFRRAVNYNRWLVDNGYMTLKADTGVMTLQDLFDDNRLLFKNVDWSKTKVYALGLGNLYINLKGREREGIVNPGAEYDAIVKDLKEKLPRIVDPKDGSNPVKAVYTRDEMYKGYDPDLTADLRVSNTPGYRVSWQTSLGGVPEALLEDNLKAWSGDHCSMDPSFVPGMFFCNRPIEKEPNMLDMAPSVLGLLGVPLPKGLEGAPIVKEAKQ